MNNITVAIDGPTGAGKTTISKHLASQLGLIYVDTGAMYRAIGLFVLRKGIDSRDWPAIEACLPDIDVEIAAGAAGQRVMLNGEDVTHKIRGEIESRYASDVSSVPQVRAALLQKQRDMARRAGVIMEGRDIGTVVLPGADVKIFLTATSEARAKRRYAELCAVGICPSEREIHEALLERDKNDSTRAIAPLRLAKDAIVIDTTHLSFDRACVEIEAIIKEKARV